MDRAYGLHLVERGYVTLSYDLLSAGERCYEGHGHFDTAPFYEKDPDWSIRGKDLWDVGRAIDLFETLEDEGITRPAFENLAENVSAVFRLLNAGDYFRSVLHTRRHGFEQEHREEAYAFLDEHLMD